MKKIALILLALLLCVCFLACKKEEGQEPESVGELEFTLLDDDTYQVKSIGTATGDTLVIPETYNDKAVTSIGISAFKNARFTSITIPASITNIEAGAFEGCHRLVEVYNLSELDIARDSGKHGSIGNYVKVVHTSADEPSVIKKSGQYSFAKINEREIYLVGYSGSATELTLPEDYEGRSYHILAYAFANHEEIITLKLTNAVLSIGNSAFEGCTAITKVTVAKYVTAIADGDGSETGDKGAFHGCARLVEVYNLSSLEIVAGASDNGMVAKNAKIVHTSADEPSIIESANGFVFASFEGSTTLLSYTGSATNLTLPADYKGSSYEIAERAFSNCTSLTNVTIPSGVTAIRRCAFINCTSLRSINIPLSVEAVGSEVFMGCTSLETILCQAQSKPSTWNTTWSFSCPAKVVWDCE